MDMLFSLLIIIGVILLIMFIMFVNSKRNDKQYIDLLNKNFGQLNIRSSYDDNRLISINEYFKRHVNEYQIDDICFNDLSIIQFFKAIDKTESDLGAQVLYYMLRTPLFDTEQIKLRQQDVEFWNNNPEIRSKVLLALHHIGHKRKYNFWNKFDDLNGSDTTKCYKYYILPILLILSVLSMFFIDSYGVLIFIFFLVHNMIVYYKEKTKLSAHVSVLNQIVALIDSASEISDSVSKEYENLLIKNINEELSALKLYKRKNGIVNNFGGEGNMFAIVINMIEALFFSDIIRTSKMKSILIEHRDNVERLYGYVGEIDALICIANYISYLGDKCVKPVFTTDIKDALVVKNLYHPLLDNPVSNSITTNKSILLTGANASGKSTFLKSIAMSVLMAQSFGYVCAECYQAPIYIVKSSMSITDDVCAGDSYYMAEIKSVKRIYDAVIKAKEKNIKVIAFIDELLRGTNTTERIAASTMILDRLSKLGAFVCGATHDLELVDLLNGYENYHFEEDLIDGDVHFSYELKTGPARSRNAIKLLSDIGFDASIVTDANLMVQKFEEEGVWSFH